MNLTLDDFSDEYLAEMSSGRCPKCGLVIELDSLIVDEDGVFRTAD